MANFKAYTVAGFAPTNIGFTSLGSGATGYAWDFGDTHQASVANPTNTYASAGVYTVSLTATNATTSTSETMTRAGYITVAVRPSVTFTSDVTTGTSPLSVNFTNTSTSTSSVTLWRWSIGSDRIYTENTSYIFTNNYTTNITVNIALRAYTPGGNVTTTKNGYITVQPAPPPGP
jgi:PKD repeat protein